MPGKNKPKRLHRHRSVRVARRKRKIEDRVTGNKRNRNPRPKKTKVAADTKPSKEVKEVKNVEAVKEAKEE